MLFSEKVETLTRTRNKARLAREAKLGDNLDNWRSGRADKNGPKFWGPVVRLANACELNTEQTTELLLLAQKPPFEELQYAKPDDEPLSYVEATRKAIAAIQRRSESGSFYFVSNYRQSAKDSPYVINEGDIIPRDRFSDEQMIPIMQEAEKRNLKLELKLVYVVASAIVAALVIVVATLIASPAARETAVRTVSPFIETIRRYFEERFDESPQQPVPTMSLEPASTPTLLPLATATETLMTTTTPNLSGTEEIGMRETDIAVAVSQTLAATTQIVLPTGTPTFTPVTGLPAPNSTNAPILTATSTQTSTPLSEPPCEVEIISPEETWPLPISFRGVPDGTAGDPRFYQPGTRAYIESVSADKRWYEVKINNSVLGWADPRYFSKCIQASQ